jgi:serine/threonine-protein kinase
MGNAWHTSRFRGGVQAIYLHSLSELESEPISGTEDGEQPFFSPDGEWLGFFAEGKLKKVSLRGGPALTLTEASSPNGASWGPDDSIVFAPRDVSGLSRVSAAGGASAGLTTLSPKEGAHRWPEFLPGGRALIFTVVSPTESDEIALYVLETGERRTLISSGSRARYAPSGHLVYARAGALFAAPFDAKRLEVTGAPLLSAEGGERRVMASCSLDPRGSLV